MIHTCHLAVGVSAGRLLCGIKRNVLRYASEDVGRHFTAEMRMEKEDGSTAFFLISEKSGDGEGFTPGTEDLHEVELSEVFSAVPDEAAEYMSSHFTGLFNSKVNILNAGDFPTMSLCIIIPIHIEGIWEKTLEIIRAVKSQKSPYDVDLLLLSHDFAPLLDENHSPMMEKQQRKTAAETLGKIAAAAADSASGIRNVILMQNCNADGAGLGLDFDGLVRILGEYVLLSICHSNDLFGLDNMNPERRITAMGISCITLDRFRFVQYLLHKAYLHILDREKVGQESVDINKVSSIAQKKLRGKDSIFRDFYAKHIEQSLNEKKSKDEIISGLKPILDSTLSDLSNDLQSFIDDPELSLPEKKATLAQILGEDDELLAGYIFNKEQLTIDDCSTEVLDIFTEANNKLLASDEETAKYAALSSATGEPSATDEPVESAASLMSDIKTVRNKIKESSSYIRQKSKELETISEHQTQKEEASKRLTDEGFIYEGTRFRFEKDLPGPPLEETYTPSVATLAKGIDLRETFSPIKNQGAMGSCTTFALSSIFEHILMKNRKEETDLSERFLYYNIRKANGQVDQDTGSSLYDGIKSLSETGICLEKYFPYDDSDLSKEPPQEAYADGATRKVIKAKNVNPNLNDLRAALTEGYPVAISLRVFNSFTEGHGFVRRPTDEEITKEQGGWHAMTACGYSDADKLFIVRNSWGTEFGDGGYCYIPYSYMTDRRLIRTCCIITEISGNLRTEGADTKMKVSFDTTDSKVREAIIRNLIEEEKVNLSCLSEKYAELTRKWHSLVQSLGKSSTRDAICTGTVMRLNNESGALKIQKTDTTDKRTKSLKDFKKATVLNTVIFAACLLLSVLIFALICHLSEDKTAALTSWWSWIFYAIMAFLAVMTFLWVGWRKRRRKDLDREFRESIGNLESQISRNCREAATANIRMFVAGTFIDRLHTLSDNLRSKYDGMTSFVGNLQTWRNEEEARDGAGEAERKEEGEEPFISVLSDEVLDAYFESRKDEITGGIRLYELFRTQYHVSEEAITAFKKGLKQKLVTELFDTLKDFSMFRHISGDAKYAYLKNDPDVGDLFRKLDRRSVVFVRPTPGSNALLGKRKSLLLDADLSTQRTGCDRLIAGRFSEPPALIQSANRFRTVMVQTCSLSPDEIDI